MSITIDSEVIEIIDAHTHMGTRPEKESLQAEAKDAKTGRAFLNSFGAEQVLKTMDEAGVDGAVGFPMGGVQQRV